MKTMSASITANDVMSIAANETLATQPELLQMLQPGTYIVAVSGGVDSVALLHLLAKSQAKQPDVRLVVAHFDHGIRTDSIEDQKLVAAQAGRLGLPYIYEEGRLGADSSEDTARRARYGFLRRAMLLHGARAIITAHHQDDVLETALLNMLRGTGRKGLTSLATQNELLRPLLQVPKQAIIKYATEQNLAWREDSTNTDLRYRRNAVRAHLMPKLSTAKRTEFVHLLARQTEINTEIDQIISEILATETAAHKLTRRTFSALPYNVSAELMAAWLRQNNHATFSKKRLHQLVVFAKTASPGKQTPLSLAYNLHVQKQALNITSTHRTPKGE